MEQTPTPSTKSTTPAKRKRSSQACRACRVAKRKCDAARPSCSSCRNSSTSRICIYDDPLEVKTKQSKLIERLQQRITDLERADERRRPNTAGTGSISTPAYRESHDSNGTGLDFATRGDGMAHQQHQSQTSHIVAPSPWYGDPQTQTVQEGNLHMIPASSTPADTVVQPGKGAADAYIMGVPSVYAGQHESPQAGSTNASRSHIPAGSVTFEHDGEDYMDPDKEELPPNDEIGVVAPRFGYFGDSSAVTFMSQVRSVLDNAEDDWTAHDETEPTSPAPVRESTAGYREPPPLDKRYQAKQRGADFELYALPSREHADALLEVFWTWVHSLYPYLDRPDFEERYEKIWLAPSKSTSVGTPSASTAASGTRQPQAPFQPGVGDRGEPPLDKKTFYCTLNIVFALGCQFDPSLNPGESRLSDVFWQRAKTLIEQDFNIFNEGSVPLIQAMLLFGVYMQSTELSGGCWTVANVATSVAQVNGLHQINSTMFNGSLSQKKLALRKRVWGGCVLLDRSLSMIYGRPSIMTSRAWIGDVFNSSATQSQASPPASECGSLSYSEFFHHHLTLHDILGAILAEFYEKPPTVSVENAPLYSSHTKGSNPNTFRAPVFIRRVNEGDFQSLLRFDTALLRWKSQLPAFLKFSPDSDSRGSSGSLDTEIAQQQAAVLHARYLHIRILLFRPLLLSALADFRKQSHEERGVEEKSSLHETLLMQSSVLCISAAQELSKMITKNLERENTRLPEWWHIIFYLYTSATVILASRCCTPLRDKIGETALQACWAECLTGLRVYQQYSRSARRCCRLLEMFDQRTKNGQYFPRPPPDSELATSNLREERQMNARMMGAQDELDLTQHTSFAVDGQNPWPFDGFQSAPSANSLDEYFNSWTPNSTDMAFLTAIPFDSGLYPP